MFVANATVQSSAVSDGTYSTWSISRQGYLSSITLGYALAVIAHASGEYRPAWADHLRTDARLTLKAGLHYLRKTGDSLLGPTTGPRPPATADDVRDGLADRRPAVRLATLWDVSEYGLSTPDLLPAVERLLTDRDPDVEAGAIGTLADFGPAAAGCVPLLIEVAWSGTPAGRAAAAYALGGFEATADVRKVLTRLLAEQRDDLVCAAAGGLGRLGPAAMETLPALLEAVETAAAVGDDNRLGATVAALAAISPDAPAVLKRHFAGRDPQTYCVAHDMLRRQGVR